MSSPLTTQPDADRCRPFWIAIGAIAQIVFAATVPALAWFMYRGASLPASAPSYVAGNGTTWWTWWPDALIDLALVAAFAVPHSVLLLPRVRSWLVARIPRQLFGGVFALMACATLWLLFIAWRPLPGGLWELSGVARTWAPVAAGLAWLSLIYALWLSGFGYQTGFTDWWAYVRRSDRPRRAFVPRGAYRLFRHPIYLGFLLITWTTPDMTTAHLLLSVGLTVYTAIGSMLKDRRLALLIGDAYRDYQARVPGYPGVAWGPLGRVPR